MKIPYTFKIYNSTSNLPSSWDILAKNNIFLSKNYLDILEKSSPKNMTCKFIGLFKNDQLIGIVLSQFLDLNQLDSFGDRDKCVKKTIRNFIFKNFSSRVLVIGNNMLTGQNAFCFDTNSDKILLLQTLKQATEALQLYYNKANTKVHITLFKDFNATDISSFNEVDFKDYYKFSTQPNMIFKINENWNSHQDYINSLSKKYRDQFKRAQKKAAVIEKRKMHLEDIIKYEKEIYKLYFYVAKNAPFNTFFLSLNHFQVFKEKLKDNFLFYGYFINDKLVGFNTLIKNGTIMDTYFLGYDEEIQREKMLYLNMLYDMIGYSINKGFKEIVLARTALEIKSSVGAKPEKMYGYIKHSNSFINKFMNRIFPYMEPETLWQERHPFK